MRWRCIYLEPTYSLTGPSFSDYLDYAFSQCLITSLANLLENSIHYINFNIAYIRTLHDASLKIQAPHYFNGFWTNISQTNCHLLCIMSPIYCLLFNVYYLIPLKITSNTQLFLICWHCRSHFNLAHIILTWTRANRYKDILRCTSFHENLVLTQMSQCMIVTTHNGKLKGLRPCVLNFSVFVKVGGKFSTMSENYFGKMYKVFPFEWFWWFRARLVDFC